MYLSEIYCRGYSGEDPPLPIPNREVKLTIADGTDPSVGRVGSCRSSKARESNDSRAFFRRTATVQPPVALRHPPVRGNATFILFRSVPPLLDLQASLAAVPARRLQPPSSLRSSKNAREYLIAVGRKGLRDSELPEVFL